MSTGIQAIYNTRRQQGMVAIVAISIVTFAICFVGVVLVRQTAPDPAGTPVGLVPPGATTPSPEYISILIVGVDVLTNPNPQLEGVWVMQLQPKTTPNYYFTGFSPQTRAQVNPGDPLRTLAEIYSGDRRINAGKSDFTRLAVQRVVPGLIYPQAEVVFDRSMLASAINLLGGIDIAGQTVRGADILRLYDAIPVANTTDRLNFQGSVLLAISEKAKHYEWDEPAINAFMAMGQQWNPDPLWFRHIIDAELPITNRVFIPAYAPLSAEATPTP